MTAKPLASLAGVALLIMPLVVPAPGALPETAWAASGLALAMALWWLTEALPLAGTALLPLALAPPLGLMDLEEVARSYSHPLIVLFLGGFLLAKAIEKSGLHRRLAASLLGHAGTDPRRILAAVMLATAFLSLWLSNTASAMVMAPIAAAIATSQGERPRFATAVMLAVAFAATIGGMGSLIGTPPNAIFAAYVSEVYAIDVGFIEWAAIGMPVAAILLLIAWLVLARIIPTEESHAFSTTFGATLNPMQSAETRVALVAGLTALAWITRPLLDWLLPGMALSDAGIAMLAAVALFLIPGGNGERLLDWETARTLRWDVLILFGGGLALASILEKSGLASSVGHSIEGLAYLPELILLLIIAAVIVYLGELASNTAMAAIFLPIAGAAAETLNVDPIGFVLPVALSASVGFMLPVATPPNAIVFANPAVTRGDMLRAGAPLDVLGILVAIGVSYLLGPLLFG